MSSYFFVPCFFIHEVNAKSLSQTWKKEVDISKFMLITYLPRCLSMLDVPFVFEVFVFGLMAQ